MFGFGKKKKAAVDKPNKQPKKQSKHNDNRDKYKDALARVVEGKRLDEAELDDMTAGIDDLDLDNDLDTELNAVKQREPVDNIDDINDIDDIDDMDILDDDTDLEELAESLPDEPDEPDDESYDVLSHKPVKVVDEKTKRLRELQETDINDIGSDAFDGFTTKDAELLLGDIDEDFEEDDDLDDVQGADKDLELVSEFEDPNEYDDPNVDLLGDEDSSSTDEDNDLLSDFELNDDEDEDESDDELLVEPLPDEQLVDEQLVDENASVVENPPVREITSEEAFNALDPVQQTILRQMQHLDTATLRTQAQMVEENLYMQSQIIEWSNAYAAQMKHLNEWQDYASKLRDLLIKQNNEYEEEKEHIARRHKVQMRNLRASIEEDLAEREDKIRQDQHTANNMIEEAARLLSQAKEHGAESKATIKGLQEQIRVLTTRPSVATTGPVPIAPNSTSDDIFKDLGLKRQLSNDTLAEKAKESVDTQSGRVADLFDDDAWD